jgi:hypothetical protein
MQSVHTAVSTVEECTSRWTPGSRGGPPRPRYVCPRRVRLVLVCRWSSASLTMTTYVSTHVERLGHIFHPEDMTYLCGIKLTGTVKGTFSSAYWTTHKDRALSVFSLCTVWKSVASVCMQQSHVGTQTLIGCSSDIETYVPYSLYATNGKYLCLNTEGLSHSGWDMVTPEWLYDWAAPAKPVLKQQTPEEWAFKMGTLCTSTTTAPNWSMLATNKGLEWVAACAGVDWKKDNQTNGYSYLSEYFRLGTYCKIGTSFRLVHSSKDWRVGARLATTPL